MGREETRAQTHTQSKPMKWKSFPSFNFVVFVAACCVVLDEWQRFAVGHFCCCCCYICVFSVCVQDRKKRQTTTSATVAATAAVKKKKICIAVST